MGTRIVFNGQEYTSPDEMPPDVRRVYDQVIQQLGDADHDGIPDIVQHGTGANVLGITHTSITVNGKTYESVDQMPAAVRKLYEEATKIASGDGRPAGTLKLSGGRLLALVLAVVLGFALMLLFGSGWHW